MEIGIDSFAACIPDPVTGLTPPPIESLLNLLDEIEHADRLGLDVFGLGEHHRAEFLDSAPAVILAAAAGRTKNIRFTINVDIPAASDPIRIFQEVAMLDLISNGRAEVVAGRTSFIESFPLFRNKREDYDSLSTEKLDLLPSIRKNTQVHRSGEHRAALTDQAIYPRLFRNSLPFWVGVGDTPDSFVRAGALGLPVMIAIIGGELHCLRLLLDLYREAGRRAGHPERLKVGLHLIGFLADTSDLAAKSFFPAYAHTFTEIRRDRSWSPTPRAQFHALRSPKGALLVGDPETVAEKILCINEVLGGISRVTFQKGVSSLSHSKMMRSIELLGTKLAPLVRKAIPDSQATASQVSLPIQEEVLTVW